MYLQGPKTALYGYDSRGSGDTSKLGDQRGDLLGGLGFLTGRGGRAAV